MKGCLLRIILLPISVAVLYPLFCLRLPLPRFELFAEGAEVAAFVAGVFVWWVIISWLDLHDMASNLGLARDWMLSDGAPTVIAGYVEAHDAVLTAPFSGEPCIAYSYRVTHHGKHGDMKSSEWTDYEGYALVPAFIRGPMRTVNVLAGPSEELFVEVPDRELTNDEDWARAAAYLEATDFGELPAGSLADTRTRLVDNGPGDFRQDKQVGEPPKDLLAHRPAAAGRDLETGRYRLVEAVVREGDRVLVAGVYQEDGEGLVPDTDTIMRPMHLVVGGEEALARKIRNRWIGIALAATLAVLTAAVYFGLFVPSTG